MSDAFSSLHPVLPLSLLLGLAVAAAWIVSLRRRMRTLRESESRFRLLFECSPDAALLFETVEATFVDCNEAALKQLRCDRTWILGKHPWDLAPAFQPCGTSSAEKAQQIMQTMAKGALRFEWQQSRGDGTDFPAEVSNTAVEVGRQPMFIAVIRDMTEWKLAQEQVEQANAGLERRVIERTAELADANLQLERAVVAERELSGLKSAFVSMVSHEFRTPLGIISSSAQILERYLPRLEPEQRAEHLQAIIDSVRRMATMMENVLVLSRVEGGRMECAPAPLELEGFCRQIIDELYSALNAASIILDCEPEISLELAMADEHLLRHILHNLLSNAVKYSPREIPPRLTARRVDGDAIFVVHDDGIGIPEDDQRRVFEAFHRGGNVSSVAGTGLGLVIVKRSCELHGGTVVFDSSEGRGTTFTVTLPLFQNSSNL